MWMRHCLSTDGNDRTSIIPDDKGGWVAGDSTTPTTVERNVSSIPERFSTAGARCDRSRSTTRVAILSVMMATYVEWRNKGRVRCKVGCNRVTPRIESTAFKLIQSTCRAVGAAFHDGIDNLSSIFVNGLMPGFQVFSGNASSKSPKGCLGWTLRRCF